MIIVAFGTGSRLLSEAATQMCDFLSCNVWSLQSQTAPVFQQLHVAEGELNK